MSGEWHEMLHEDCRGVDPVQLGHDVLMTDPPYSERVHANMTSCAHRGEVKGVQQRDARFDYLSSSLQQYVLDAANCAQRWSLIYTDIQAVNTWEQGLHDHVRTLPWVRWSSPQFSGDRPPSGCELVVIGHPPTTTKTWRGRRNMIALDHKCLRGKHKHATGKPLDQALELVSAFSEPCELIYDPCAGRGTFGVAAALLGRDYVGCEHFGDSKDPKVQALSAEECAKAQARIAAAEEGYLDKTDRERLEQWLTSVLLLSGAAADEAEAFAKEILGKRDEPVILPDEFKALVKGKLP